MLVCSCVAPCALCCALSLLQIDPVLVDGRVAPKRVRVRQAPWNYQCPQCPHSGALPGTLGYHFDPWCDGVVCGEGSPAPPPTPLPVPRPTAQCPFHLQVGGMGGEHNKDIAVVTVSGCVLRSQAQCDSYRACVPVNVALLFVCHGAACTVCMQRAVCVRGV